MDKIQTYLKEVYVELFQKTSWPTFKELQKDALIVLIASVLFACLVAFGMDGLLQRLMNLVYKALIG